MHQREIIGGGMATLLIEAAEDSHTQRTVWRMILPDPAGNLSPLHLTPPFLDQYRGTNPQQVKELKRWVCG